MTHPDAIADPSDLLARAAKVRLACFDVDGTLTDGRLFFDQDHRESKSFHVLDGQGLALMRRSGIPVAFVTARVSQVALNRARELGVEAYDGVKDKLACVDALRTRLALSMDEVAFMGDDLPDLGVLRAVGFAVAPANVHPWIRGDVHWVTRARGGHGAAREFCDLVLQAQGKVEALLARPHP